MPSIFVMMRTLAFFANRNKEVRSVIEGIETRILVTTKEEEPFYLELSNGKISVRRGEPERFDASLRSDKKTLNEVIAGRLSQEDAFNKKLIETTGSMPDAMRFRYVINKTLQESRMLKLARKLSSVL